MFRLPLSHADESDPPIHHVNAGAPRGKIRLQTEEVPDSKYSISLQLSATKLDKKDLFGKVCP